MPVSLRGVPPALAALFGGVLAAFVLTDLPGGRWAVEVSDRELDRWLGAQPTGIAAGVVVAVASCLALQCNGSRRLAWAGGAVATVPVILVRVAAPEVAGVDGLITLHVVKCIAAGALLGCTVAATWAHRGPQLALTGGAVTGFLSASAFGAATATASTSTFGEPSRGLLALALVTTAAAAVTANGASRITRITGPEAGAALLTVAAVAVVNRALLAWIDSNGGQSRTHQWVVIGIAMTVVLVVTELCARFVARRVAPGEGAIVLVATGVAAAAMPVLVDLRSPFRDVPGWAAVAVAGAAVVVGAAVAARRPAPIAGLAVTALVPVVGAISPDFGEHGPWLLVRLAVLGAGAGWAVVATLPLIPAVAAAGLSIPFVSMVFHAAVTVIVPTEPTRINFAVMADSLFLTSDSELLLFPAYDDRIAGIALTIAVAFCAWGVHSLRRTRR